MWLTSQASFLRLVWGWLWLVRSLWHFLIRLFRVLAWGRPVQLCTAVNLTSVALLAKVKLSVVRYRYVFRKMVPRQNYLSENEWMLLIYPDAKLYFLFVCVLLFFLAGEEGGHKSSFPTLELKNTQVFACLQTSIPLRISLSLGNKIL